MNDKVIGESFVNLRRLRKLYGKSVPGKKNRVNFKITITPETIDMLSQHVRLGFGGYGSPFIELSTRLLLAMIGNGEEIPAVCDDLKSISKSPYLQNNVRIFKEFMEK